MTAFGRATGGDAGKRYTVEIKSVNNRFLDLTVKAPRSAAYLEEPVRAMITAAGVTRGKIEVYITLEVLSEEDTTLALDVGMAENYLNALYALRDTFDLKDDISVMRVASNRDLFRTVRANVDEASEIERFTPIFAHALDAYLAMRKAEGTRLYADLLGKLETLKNIRARILSLADQASATYRTKLEARLRQALNDNTITMDESRILTECAIYADRIAVDEEMVRLSSHFDALRDALDSSEAVGRRLDFLIQEINREINTTGSKSQDTAISALVIDFKCELEKIREQVQNIE